MTFPQFTPGAAPLAGAPVAPSVGFAAQPAPQQFAAAPAMVAPAGPDIGAMLLGATVGVVRYPHIPEGQHTFEITQTLKPKQATALIVEVKVIDSTTRQPGEQFVYYQNLAFSNVKQQAARYGQALAFEIAASGFQNKDQLCQAIASQAPVGTPPEQIQAMIAGYLQSFLVAPGPCKGRKVRCIATVSGQSDKGLPYHDYVWSPVA